MKNVFYLSVMVLSVLHLLSCSNSSAPLEPDVKIGNVAIKHTPVTFNDKKVIPGYLNGVDFTKGIVFIERPFPDKRKWTIDLFTLDSHKLIRTLRLASGSFESPTLFYGPHHYENIGDKYVIVDQIHKFVFFDRDFNHLFSSRFHCYRFFVDFHTRNGEIYFVIGHRSSRGAGLQLLVELFKISPGERPEKIKELLSTSTKALVYKRRKREIPTGYFWPRVYGFEKSGVIYYAANQDKRIYKYNPVTGKTETIELSYLEPLTFTQEDVDAMGNHNNPTWPARYKLKPVNFAPLIPVYHFGIYDAGKEKIALIRTLNPRTSEMDVDILDAGTLSYLETIRLPFGRGMIDNNSSDAKGILPTFLNVDEGLYLWNDTEEEDQEDYARIYRFTMERGGTDNKK